MVILEMLVILAMVRVVLEMLVISEMVRVVLEMLLSSASDTSTHGEAPTEMVMLTSGACQFGFAPSEIHQQDVWCAFCQLVFH